MQEADGNSRNGNGRTAAGSPVVRVALLDSDDLMREGLVALMGGVDDLACVGAWATAEEALAEIEAARPDVLVMDVRLPDQSCLQVFKSMPIVSPATRVLVMVDCREEGCIVLNPPASNGHPKATRTAAKELAEPDDCLQVALKMGVHGALHRQRPFREIHQAIRAVHAGTYWLEPTTAARLAQQHLMSLRLSHVSARTGAQSLTLRERQVVTLISQGRSNKEIARELQLGYSTVKNYVSSVLEKLALSDRTQIALYAISQIGPDA